MKLYINELSKNEVDQLFIEYGKYTKITADIVDNKIVVGCVLHADAEPLLLESGSITENIWGGGINFETKVIDTTAVFNLRPSLNNPSMEIIDSERRSKFIELVSKYLKELWTT